MTLELSIIYFIVSVKTVGRDPWVGVVSGMGMGLAGLFLPFIRCQLSVVVNLSFSYNTLFLSSLGFMAAQYTPSSVYFFNRSNKK